MLILSMKKGGRKRKRVYKRMPYSFVFYVLSLKERTKPAWPADRESKAFKGTFTFACGSIKNRRHFFAPCSFPVPVPGTRTQFRPDRNRDGYCC